MPLERINLTGMYQPNRNIYLQVVKATGGTQLHLAGTVQFDEEQNVVGISEMKAPVVKIQENIKVSLNAGVAAPSNVGRLVHPDWLVKIEVTAIVN